MRRLLPLISALMLVLLLWSGTAAHAAGASDCGEVAESSIGHFEGDDDQVPADTDQATPHHHNACHGHCVAVSTAERATPVHYQAIKGLIEVSRDFQSGSGPGAAIRPPIA